MEDDEKFLREKLKECMDRNEKLESVLSEILVTLKRYTDKENGGSNDKDNGND